MKIAFTMHVHKTAGSEKKNAFFWEKSYISHHFFMSKVKISLQIVKFSRNRFTTKNIKIYKKNEKKKKNA